MSSTRLCSNTISEISKVKLNAQDSNIVEFCIKKKDCQDFEWVQHTNINHQSLSSKKFKSFYVKLDQNIIDFKSLTDFLTKRNSNNNNNNNSHSQPENSDHNQASLDSENRSINNKYNTIRLQIQHCIKEYDIGELKQLSYFNVMFSQRWMKNRDKNEIIKIFDNDNSNANVIFNFNDLELLLQCARIDKIPATVKPDRKTLEGLMKCHDFCMNGNDIILDEDILINYFKSTIPAISWNTMSREQVLDC